MTRSEMIALIDNFLRYNDERNYANDGEAILDYVESQGMLPPLIEVEILKDDGFRVYKRNEWEEETQKKSKKKKRSQNEAVRFK